MDVRTDKPINNADMELIEKGYTETRDGSTITLWDKSTGIGLRFQEGESMQRYVCSLVMPSPDYASTDDGVATLERVGNALRDVAAQKYLTEFAELRV